MQRNTTIVVADVILHFPNFVSQWQFAERLNPTIEKVHIMNYLLLSNERFSFVFFAKSPNKFTSGLWRHCTCHYWTDIRRSSLSVPTVRKSVCFFVRLFQAYLVR